jgi:hypothetical protein
MRYIYIIIAFIIFSCSDKESKIKIVESQDEIVADSNHFADTFNVRYKNQGEPKELRLVSTQTLKLPDSLQNKSFISRDTIDYIMSGDTIKIEKYAVSGDTIHFNFYYEAGPLSSEIFKIAHHYPEKVYLSTLGKIGEDSCNCSYYKKTLCKIITSNPKKHYEIFVIW